LHGIFAPITTPFYPGGKVYFRKLEHNVERYSRAPLAGLVVLGSTGEAVMLSDEERMQVLREARQAAADDKVLIAGTGAESVTETLRLSEFTASLNYDAVLVRTPHFYRAQMQPQNLLTYYRTVADGSPLPVLLYNVPAFTQYDLPAELVAELAEHPNIIGIKESGGSMQKIAALVKTTRHIRHEVTVTEVFSAVTNRMLQGSNQPSEKLVHVAVTADGAPSADTKETVPNTPAPSFKTRTKNAGFQVLSGTAHLLLESLEQGAVGAIAAFSDLAPTACFEIYAAWKDRDLKLAQEKQARIVQAAKKIVGEYSIPGIKYAQDLNGYYGGPSRLPLLPLSAEQKNDIERLLANIRN
jgi:4-hydroxy-2-oxoglutarate aldolase